MTRQLPMDGSHGLCKLLNFHEFQSERLSILGRTLWSPGWTRRDIVWCVEQPRFRSGSDPWERLTRNSAGKAE